MKAAILCAGFGTRLRPLTDFWPKAAIPFLGQPLFRYTLASLKKAGVSAVGINTHHLGRQMAAVAEEECERAGVPLTISKEPEILGTGGGIRGLQAFLEDDVFLVVNGDILFSFELAPLIAAHRASSALATLALMPMPAGESFAAVEMDQQNRIHRLAGRGPGAPNLKPWHFTGVHVLNPRIFQFMSSSGAEDINRDVYPRAISREEEVRGFLVEGYWTDLGSPRRYLQAQADFLYGRVQIGTSPFASAMRLGESSWVGPGAIIKGQVVDPSFLDRGSTTRSGARIGPAAYIGPGAVVESGASVENAAVLPGATVNALETLRDAIAWDSHRFYAKPTPSP